MVVGFSGTKDNHRLLPLGVKQDLMTDEPLIHGTDGKMLDLVMRMETIEVLRGTDNQQVRKKQYITVRAVCKVEKAQWTKEAL